MNDPKYLTGPIINTASGELIPQDEPVFIFRARDIQACVVLEFYKELLDGPNDDEHRLAVDRRLEDFYRFRHEFPDRMKHPDTDLERQGTYQESKDQCTEETSDRIGRIAAEILAAPNTEDVEERMPYHELLRLSKSLAGSCLTQRPTRG